MSLEILNASIHTTEGEWVDGELSGLHIVLILRIRVKLERLKENAL